MMFDLVRDASGTVHAVRGSDQVGTALCGAVDVPADWLSQCNHRATCGACEAKAKQERVRR